MKKSDEHGWEPGMDNTLGTRSLVWHENIYENHWVVLSIESIGNHLLNCLGHESDLSDSSWILSLL